MLWPDAWCAFHGPLRFAVFNDGLCLWAGVAEPPQRSRHGAVHDLHRAATDQTLDLDERKVWFHARGVAIHHEGDRAGGRDQRDLRVPDAVGFAEPHRLAPR